ncbi:Uncharacterised protein [[Clostridium] sordellii]|uniref:hypothetical protein n=1 Tax=Paraclostridium sordellii TaxID=1505 RepID=UPI0005E2FF2A|nr:hypothetical protein [Paeniclostridium sordellii]CEP39611.1 Uncharacterised protein [[Clostridium] sordellii] [Paeniclostridium sordellii]
MIRENSMELIRIFYEICEEKKLDIKEIVDKKDFEFYEVWKEAGIKFDELNKSVNSCCEKCKRHEENIKDLKFFLDKKKKDWDGKGNLIQEAVIIGLDTALEILE